MKISSCTCLVVLILAKCFAGSVAAQPAVTKLTEFGGPNQSQRGLVEGADGTLYGWHANSDPDFRGAIFKVNKDGSGFTTLHPFAGTAEGGDSPADLIYASDGALYGVAVDSQARTHGRVFTLSPSGGGFRVLKRFDRTVDGTASPFALLEASDGALYGVTQVSGTLGSSTIFKINKDGSGFQEVYDFEGGEASPNTAFGPGPMGGLTEGPDGKLYGLNSGGSAELGAAFRLNRDGSGYETIHDFTGEGQGSGAIGRLRYATDGFFYGVGNNGGSTNRPVVFKLRPDGSGFQVIVTAPVASLPSGQLSESGDGYLYATAYTGGQFAAGLLFRVKRDGSDYQTLHEFDLLSNPRLGIQPSPLVHASDGYFYFSTFQQVTFDFPAEWRLFLLRSGPAPRATPVEPPVAPVIVPQFLRVGQNSEFKLAFRGEPGRQYDIQFTDLLPANWQSAQKITAGPQGEVEFTDNLASSRLTRFFRVVVE